MSFVTQNQIATEAGVSRSTVQAVLSSTSAQSRISPQVREHVLAVATRLNYRPNRFAQAMRKGKSGLIGIINFGDLYELTERKVLAASEAIVREGYEPLVQESIWSSRGSKGSDVSREVCRRMLESRVEGVLLVNPGGVFRQEHLDQLLKAGIPVVTSGGAGLLQGVPDFVSDREWGYEQVARHLFGLGYRRLALIAMPDSDVGAATARAAENFGIEEMPPALWPLHHLPERPGPHQMLNFRVGKEAMTTLLAGPHRPEAVLCSNDEVAQGALTACGEAGVRIPDDLAVTGFDDFFSSEYGLVPLTTLTHPIAEISTKAVACLLELIRTGRKPQTHVEKIRGHLTIRRSCGAFLQTSRSL